MPELNDINSFCNKIDQTVNIKYYVIEFKGHRREIFENKCGLNIKKNDKVIVEIESGNDIGTILYPYRPKFENQEKITLPKIIKIADEQDLDKDFLNKYDESDAIFKTNDFVQNLGLDMKVIDAEWQFDRQKLTVFFTSPSRVDFRELIKDLARQFKTRIELRQISAREETKRIGCGVGCCGQTICCTSFLFDFNQVTIDHAKIQQLSNNVTKLTGNCGRLKCCLLFEYEHYSEELEKYPPINSMIEMEEGTAVVNKIDIFKKNITLYNSTQKKLITIEFEELNKYIKAGKVTITKPETQYNETTENFAIEELLND